MSLIKNILNYESKHHRIISFVIHLIFLIYLSFMIYYDLVTPRWGVISISLFIISYGITIFIIATRY